MGSSNNTVPPWHKDRKVCINYPSHIIKITTITEGLDGGILISE